MKNILVVDDSTLILGLLDKELKDIPNTTVLKAKTLASAKDIINNYPIHVAVLDVNLPDAKRGEVIDLVTEHGIPAIVFSGTLDQHLKQEIMQKDILEYVNKSNIRSVQYIKKIIKRTLDNYNVKVIVADDSRTIRAIVIEQLSKMNITVFEAENGRDAMRHLEKHGDEISLIITDYNMPEMDGLDLVLNVRDHYKKDQIAIIVLSTVKETSISTKFLKLGANDFLNKPFQREELNVRVNSNLELLQLFNETKELSNRDFLTGAFNRRYFYDSGASILAKAKRKSLPLLTVILDIDNFKSINDTYGHDVGDVAIKEVTRILAENLRNSDLVSRFGGEEFCILFEDITYENSEKILETLRDAFESNRFPAGSEEIAYTVSIGGFYGLKEDLDAMIKEADTALYEAKNNGKNRVIIYN
jgi:diguanylate cyclase (GGDEF)-like protein